MLFSTSLIWIIFEFISLYIFHFDIRRNFSFKLLGFSSCSFTPFKTYIQTLFSFLLYLLFLIPIISMHFVFNTFLTGQPYNSFKQVYFSSILAPTNHFSFLLHCLDSFFEFISLYVFYTFIFLLIIVQVIRLSFMFFNLFLHTLPNLIFFCPISVVFSFLLSLCISFSR